MDYQFKIPTYKERTAAKAVRQFVQYKEARLQGLVYWLYSKLRTDEPCFICYDFLKLEVCNTGILKVPSNIGMYDPVHQKTYFFNNPKEAAKILDEIQVDIASYIIDEKDFTLDNKMAMMKLKIKDIEDDFKR